ncbi:GNAT domain-containing protein [Xylariales sp. PMI_506]|nr:GNAT domain-containing protein [Xylariales sp. PMI_506]
MAAPSKTDSVSVKTTLPVRPLPANSSRAAITTDRLIIRALASEDLPSFHALRTQPEIMANNPQGRPDRDLEETKPKLALSLPPNDETTYNFAICLRETGEMIGTGGCYRLTKGMFGWPTIGYMIRKEFWGQGITTEFLRAWLDMWWKLPREEVEISVDPRTLFTEDGTMPEQIVTWSVSDNFASQRVLEKSGFDNFLNWREPDLRDPNVEVELRAFRIFAPNYLVK